MDKQQKPGAGQFLTFQINTEMYGIAISSVREINQYGSITPVPKTMSHVKGVINLRGQIIPVISMRGRLGLDEISVNKETCVVVVDTNHGQVGVIVDRVHEVINLKDEQIEAAPRLTLSANQNLVIGVAKAKESVVVLLDISDSLSLKDIKFDESAIPKL